MKRTINILLAICCLAAPSLSAQETLHLSLEDCRAMALRENENLKKADNALQQSDIDKQNAFTAYLPTVSGSAMAIYTKDIEAGGTSILLRGTYMAGFSLQQVIYAGGRVKAGNELAKIGTEVAREQLRKTRQEVLLEADKAYYGLIAVHQKVKMLESYVGYISALDTSVAGSVEAEMATKADRLRIQAKLSEIRYNLQKAQNGEELCRLYLCNVIGADFNTKIAPQDTVIQIDGLQNLNDDVSLLPEIQLLQKGVAAKEKQVKQTLGEHLPSLALMGGWTYFGNMKIKGVADYQGQQVPYTQTNNQGFWFGTLSLSVPLWNWGKSWRSVKRAKIDASNARLDLQRNSRLLTIQTRQAIQNVTSAYTLVETASLGYEQAAENLRIMREKYDASLCTLTDLLDAQSQSSQAESNLIEAKTQYRIYQSEYQKATGTLGE